MNQNNNKIVSGLAVELYLDADGEKKVLDFRNRIYQAGVQPVLGLMNDKPHVSLAVIPAREAKDIVRLTSEFSREISRISYHLSAIGIFPTPDNVLFAYASPSEELLDAHKKFHAVLNKAGITSSRYYDPGKWVPHLTLEFNLSDDDLSLAARIAQKLFTPISGEFTQLGVVAFRPIEYLDHFELKEKNNA